MSFLHELLDVLWGGATGAGLEKTTSGEKRHDGKHLGAGAQFEDGKEVGQVITQYVPGC